MPRQLPWKVKGDPGRKASSSSSTVSSLVGRSSPAIRRPKKESTPDLPRKSGRSLVFDADRSPTSSPPPSEPPKEEFMIEGVEHDDKYRMVEDELLAMAGQFTRHLHAAEYQRLKDLSRSKNAEAIHNISRPITAKMSDLVKRRYAALDTAAKQQKGLTQILGKRKDRECSVSPKKPIATALQDLLESPRNQIVPVPLPLPRTTSRHRDRSPSMSLRATISRVQGGSTIPSAAGDRKDAYVSKFTHEATSATNDGDLDVPACRASKMVSLPSGTSQTSRTAKSPGLGQLIHRTELSPSTNPFTQFSAKTGRVRTLQEIWKETSNRSTVKQEPEDEEEDFFARLRARRVEQRRRREAKRQELKANPESQPTKLDEIPFI